MMNSYFTVALLASSSLASLALALPNPMAQSDDGSPRSETDKCDEFEYQEFLGEQLSCEAEARHELNEVLSSFDFTKDELRRALCSTIRGRISCLEDNGPKCFSDEEVEGIRLNMVFKEFGKFFNLTERLGTELIDDCPTMVNSEDALLLELAGSTRCNFREYETSRAKMQTCRSDASDKRSFRLDLLDFVPNPREFFISTACQEKQDYLGCSEAYKSCLAGDDLAFIVDDENAFFGRIQDSVQKVISEFTFEDSCDGGVARKEEDDDDEFAVDVGLKLDTSSTG